MTSDERLTFGSGLLDRSLTMYTPQTIRAITEDIDLSTRGSIIDIGAGRGYLLDAILRRQSDRRPAYAVDIDEELLLDRDDVTSIVASGATSHCRMAVLLS